MIKLAGAAELALISEINQTPRLGANFYGWLFVACSRLFHVHIARGRALVRGDDFGLRHVGST